MKASDLVTSSRQRYEATQDLLQTEETDAVNSGLVRSADKSALPSRRRIVPGGMSNAAFAAAAKSRRKSESGPKAVGRHSGSSAAIDAVRHPVADASGARTGSGKSARNGIPSAAGTVAGHHRRRRGRTARAAVKGRAAISGNSAAAGQGASLRQPLKARAMAAAEDAATRKVLEGTELEGADGLYYKGKAGVKAARAVGRLSLRGGRSVVRSVQNIRDRFFSRQDAPKAAQAAEATRRAQAAGYAKRTIYSAAAKAREAAAASKAAATASGTVAKGGFGKALAVLASPMLVAVLLVVCLVLCIAGAAGEQERRNSAMDGLPGWVTYDLVLACLEARDAYGYPASALLGQMMIENGTSDGGSDLGRLYHNYGGVKYSGSDYGGLITGSVRLLTTEVTSSGTAYQTYADFAVFASDEAYMTYRCEYLYQQPNYTGQPNFQKAIDANDSRLFLQALGEGGYYTAPVSEYLAQYQSICETYPLVPLLDSLSVEDFQSSYDGSLGGGEDYQSAEAWQRRIVDACRRTPFPGESLCATWVSNVYENAGLPRPTGNGNSILSGSSTTSTDWSAIKVGQILSAQAAPTAAGARYGHTAIYIGDGMVMESVSGAGVRTKPLTDWVSYYSAYGWVKYGWPW